MKFSKFIPLILLILVLLAGGSCSCGGDGGKPTPTSTPSPTPSPTANATLTPTPITEYLEYIDEENGFAISYPQGWEMLPHEYWSNETLAFFWTGQADMQCAPQFYLSREELDQPTSVQDWFEQDRGNLTASEGYSPISEEMITVDGNAAIKHVLTVEYGEATLQLIRLYLVKDTSGWLLNCVCLSDCWPRYGPNFETVAVSLRFLD